MLQIADLSVANMTSLVGYIDASYDELVAKFGPPNSPGDGYKTDAEWVLQTEDGQPVTIYNYKDGKNYEGASGLDVKDIRNWHVGGNGPYALDAVQRVLNA